jgi:gas vesicle protein
MYYDDEARRFNFASGLLLGAVLGTGLALLAAPQKPFGKPKRLRSSAAAVKKGVRDRLEGVPESVDKVRRAARRAAR